MSNTTLTYPEDLVRAAMASERMLELQRNAERLMADLDASIFAHLRREFPDADPFDSDEGLMAEARRRLVAETEKP